MTSQSGLARVPALLSTAGLAGIPDWNPASVFQNQDRPTISSTSTTQQTHREPPHPIPIEHIDPDALKVVRRLKRYGHTAYLVGGCVRDLLLGRTPKDFDVGTSARPRQVKHLFRNSRIIGRRFRLVHVVFGKKVIEVATFRSQHAPSEPEQVDEAAAGENPPVVDGPEQEQEQDRDLLIRNDNVFGTPVEDAFRRDFTVNALFYDPETAQVIDHVGGLADLERRVLRTIGDPDIRFKEDPVRIVRAVKFAARLHFAIDPATFDAMIRNRGELSKAAPPRLAEEVVRLAQGGSGAESFRLMHDLGILQYVAPLVTEALAKANEKKTIDAGANGLFWRQLEQIDRWPHGPTDVSRATVLACVYGPVWRQAVDSRDAQRDPGAAFFNAIRPAIQDRLLSRREADRMKLIYVAQRRLESPPGAGEQAPQGGQPHPGQGGGGRRRRRRRGGGGGGRGLAARDYFREAVAYFRLEAAGRGKASDAWDAWEALLPQAPPVREVLPFRRRAEEALAQAPHEHVDDERQPTPEEIAAVNSLPEDEEFHGRRRRRGGRLSENARERERMEQTRPGESGGIPEPPKPVLGEDGLPVPKLTKPERKRPIVAQPQPQAVVAPPPPPPQPKLPPSERIARAMASENGHPLINPYTGKPYIPRKVFDEVPVAVPLSHAPAGPLAAEASGGVSAAVSEATPAGGYTLDEFEQVGEPEAEAGLLPTPEEKRPEKRQDRGQDRGQEKKADAGRSQPPQQPGQPGGEGRRKRRRRGRRGRGRGGNRPNGGGGGGGGGGNSAPPAGGAPPSST